MHSFLHKTRHFMLICARKHQKLRFTCRAAGFSTARTNNTKGETCMSKSWKTRWCSLLLVLSMLAGLCAPVYAAPEPDSPVSKDTGVNDNIVIDQDLGTIVETGEVIWSSDFDTAVEDLTWDGGQAPEGFILAYAGTKKDAKIELDATESHSTPYSVHVTGVGSGRTGFQHDFKSLDCTQNYVFTAWVKTADSKSASASWKGPRFEIQFYESAANPKSVVTPAIEGTSEWYKITLDMPSEQLIACNGGKETGNIRILLDCNASKGEIWVDDLELICTGEPEGPGTDPEPEPEPEPPISISRNRMSCSLPSERYASAESYSVILHSLPCFLISETR